jgi:hypothetical protein
VEVKIGVQNASRELVLESKESADTVEKTVSAALATDDGVLVLTDAKGRKVLVPVAKLAYVEIGTATSGTVGFRS